MKLKYMMLAALACISLAVSAQAQSGSTPPPGAYLDNTGAGYRDSTNHWLPGEAGNPEADGSKAADSAWMTHDQQRDLIDSMEANNQHVPTGLRVAHYNFWGSYHRVPPPTQPRPPYDEY